MIRQTLPQTVKPFTSDYFRIKQSFSEILDKFTIACLFHKTVFLYRKQKNTYLHLHLIVIICIW